MELVKRFIQGLAICAAVGHQQQQYLLGIYDVVQAAVQKLGIPAISGEQCTKLVGIETDGAAANIAGAGLKGLVEKELPWIFWMWCMAHRLELAVKDAF